MARFRSFFAVVASVVSLADMLATGAWAAPSTPNTLTYEFSGCTGPAGTPVAFDAVKQPGEAAALHLTDGSGNFVAMAAVDVASGDLLSATPGFEHNDLATVTCSSDQPQERPLAARDGAHRACQITSCGRGSDGSRPGLFDLGSAQGRARS